MGVCASCLGNRRGSDEDASSRLLFDDPHTVNYGSFGEQNPGTSVAEPQDVQRESEVLQKIVAQTSNHLVDIFAMVPQNLQRSPATTYSGQDTRLLQYQEVLAKLSTDNMGENEGKLSSINSPPPDAMDWLSDDDENEDEAVKNFKIVKSKTMGPLLGGFADVENSLK